MVKCFPPLVYGIHNGHLLHLKLWHANWSFPCTRAKHWVYISLRIIYPRYVIQIPLQDSPPPFPHQHNRPLYEDMKSPSDPIPHNKHRNITPYFGAFSCFVIHANTNRGGGGERSTQRKCIEHQKARKAPKSTEFGGRERERDTEAVLGLNAPRVPPPSQNGLDT